MTDYLILRSVQGGTWEVIGSMEARSARSAIRERIDGAGQSSEHAGEGTYVAVPSRSWQPVKVAVETKTALKFV